MSDCYCILKCSLVEKTGAKASGDGHEKLLVFWLVSTRSVYVPRGLEYRPDPLKLIPKHNCSCPIAYMMYNLYILTDSQQNLYKQ